MNIDQLRVNAIVKNELKKSLCFADTIDTMNNTMNNRINIFNVIIMVTVSLQMGCGKQISEFVGKGRLPANLEGAPKTPSTTSVNEGISLSPGAAYVSGIQVEGRVSLSPNKQILKGSQVQVEMSLNQNWPK